MMSRVIKERPILFSGPMVQAILAGRKTQTRREVKAINHDLFDAFTAADPSGFWGFDANNDPVLCVHSPYGEVGDRLWVRETVKATATEDGIDCIHYMADDHCRSIMVSEYGPWRKLRGYGEGHSRTVPSIHMPRWASRITLEITGVRVERLNAISEEDAKAEGTDNRSDLAWGHGGQGDDMARWAVDHGHRYAFCHLWDSISGDGAWSLNPWVWVVEFKRA